MDLWNEPNWYAIHAKPHRERLAASSIALHASDVLLPLMRAESNICGCRRIVIKPLFTGYLFARFTPSKSFETVRNTRGVSSIVSSRMHPVPVDDEVIASIRERIEADGFVRLEPPALRPGSRVTIEQGPLQGFIGRVAQAEDDGRRVTVLLEALLSARVSVESNALCVLPDAA
jgi:transcriptional antiterminator RfaH